MPNRSNKRVKPVGDRNQLYRIDNMLLSQNNRVMAKWNQEQPREPKKGEYYLSGGMAYCAPNDLTDMFYFIAELVNVEKSISYKTTPYTEQKI